MTIFSGLLFSCKMSEMDIEREHIRAMLENENISKKAKWIVILPGLGCHGCIKEGEMFLVEQINNDEIFIVLTNIESLKILQHKLGIQVDKHNNIYVDRDDQFRFTTGNNIYPCVVYLNDGRYESHEFQAPRNNAFHKLSTIILTE